MASNVDTYENRGNLTTFANIFASFLRDLIESFNFRTGLRGAFDHLHPVRFICIPTLPMYATVDILHVNLGSERYCVRQSSSI